MTSCICQIESLIRLAGLQGEDHSIQLYAFFFVLGVSYLFMVLFSLFSKTVVRVLYEHSFIILPGSRALRLQKVGARQL